MIRPDVSQRLTVVMDAIARRENADDDVMAKAVLLAASVRRSLERGVPHYNRAGQRLMTAIEVLECLRDEGEVTLGGNAEVGA